MKKKLLILIVLVALGIFIGFSRTETFQVWNTFASNVLIKYNLYVTGNTILGDAATDSITATGYWTKLRVGTGSTPGITHGVDDVFIEGTCEVDDELQVDGIFDANSTSDFAGDAVFNEDVTLGSAADDKVTVTAYFVSFRVGTGDSPDINLGADDVFIEGTLEVNSEVQTDALLDVNSQMDVADAVTIQLTAGENLTKGNVVVLIPDDVEDLMNSYADQAAYQAVYVDSDAGNKMVDEEATNFATGLKALKMVATNGNNSNDYVSKTISSKDMSALTIHLLARGTATSGDWQVRIGTGNLNTDYYQSAIVLAGANTYEHLTFLVSGMTGAGASEDDTAITRVGFFCVDDTGGSTLLIDRIWYTSGSGDYVAMKADSDDWDLMPPLGIAYETINDGSAGGVAIAGILDGFTGLVPGGKYYADDATAGALVVAAVEAAVNGLVGIAISETELRIIPNGSVN